VLYDEEPGDDAYIDPPDQGAILDPKGGDERGRR